jgi:predicted DNA-binding protein
MATEKRLPETGAPTKRAMKGKQAQITLTLPPELLARVNQKAERLSISRAAFMKMAITRAVEAEAP